MKDGKCYCHIENGNNSYCFESDCPKHGKKEIKKMKCKYLHSDWCHHPCLEFQEHCGFYMNQRECPMFKELKK